MRRFFPVRSTPTDEAAQEPGAPPHVERPTAATESSTPARLRRALRSRAARLPVAAVVLAVLASACVWDPGPQVTSGSAPAPAPVPGTPPLEHWYALAQCETGGNWAAPGPTYVGGLGMWVGNWAAHGGLQYAPSADLATPEQQIAVATNLWLAGGSWGCKIGDGWDHR